MSYEEQSKNPFDFRKMETEPQPENEIVIYPMTQTGEGGTKPRVRTKKLTDGAVIEVAQETPMHLSNVPYIETYEETNSLLRGVISDMSYLGADIKQDLDEVRRSKTLKMKYTIISNIVTALSQTTSTKLNAIKELNATITKGHDLDFKRVKELSAAASQSDDSKSVLDMYNAFISGPGLTGVQHNLIGTGDISSMNGPFTRVGTNPTDYNNYQQSMSPALLAMRYENNPNVKEVVVYDQSTGARWFDIIDMSTGESIPGLQRTDQMFLEGLVIDINSPIVKDTNLDKTYPLKIIGSVNNRY